MTKNVLAEVAFSNQTLQKSKPRYTEAENQLIFDSWWNPQKRRELAKILERDMSALRSQFSRLLKDKGLSNQAYYQMMSNRTSSDNTVTICKRNREFKSTDQVIFDTFCKHQALGNARTKACEELMKEFGDTYTPAALKLRFYRMVNKLNYQDEDLLRFGKKLLAGENISSYQPKETPELLPTTNEFKPVPESGLPTLHSVSHTEPDSQTEDQSFFYELSSMPEMTKNLLERVNHLEELQRRQLDLRGFIEHLLAVERDIKREDKLVEEIQRLMDDNESIQRSADKEKDRLKKREDELAEVYQILNTLLSEFMRLESVSKLASLGDFMHRLEITVDQFGNVMRSRRVG